MNQDPIDEQKFLEVDKPVSKKKAQELDNILLQMNEIAKRHNHNVGTSGLSDSICLQVGTTHYAKISGKWVREAKVRNPQYNPNKVKYGNAWCSVGKDMQIIIFSCPIGLTDFHGKMMKLFRQLGWKYTSSMQVEGCEDSIWNTKKFPKYSIAMDGTIKKESS
ncbi:MAG: hypothetical protein WC375_05440 [Methanomassiliicoccales archaeon]|jgi:hypothetical protein